MTKVRILEGIFKHSAKPSFWILKRYPCRCPSRTCPNPDVVKPVWEKHIKDKMMSTPPKKVVVSSTGSMTSNGMIRKKKPLTKTVIIQTPSSTVMKGRTSSLLREALLLPQRPLPKAYVLQSKSSDVADHKNQVENSSSCANPERGVRILKCILRLFLKKSLFYRLWWCWISQAQPYLVTLCCLKSQFHWMNSPCQVLLYLRQVRRMKSSTWLYLELKSLFFK